MYNFFKLNNFFQTNDVQIIVSFNFTEIQNYHNFTKELFGTKIQYMDSSEMRSIDAVLFGYYNMVQRCKFHPDVMIKPNGYLKEDFADFKKYVFDKLGIKENPNPDHLVLIKRESDFASGLKTARQRRHIVNFKEIECSLENVAQQHKLKFKTIEFAHLPIKKQIELSNNTKYLIGCHGSGLVNLYWMNNNSHVLEIEGNKHFRSDVDFVIDDAFKDMARVIGYKSFDFVKSEITTVPDNKKGQTSFHIKVDSKTLINKLKEFE